MLSFRIVFQSLKWVKFHTQMTTYTIEHIELPAKLLDYFLRSHKSNIKQCFVGILTAQLRVYFTHVSYKFSFWPWEFMNRMNHMNSRSIHKQPTCWWFPYRKACSFRGTRHWPQKEFAHKNSRHTKPVSDRPKRRPWEALASQQFSAMTKAHALRRQNFDGICAYTCHEQFVCVPCLICVCTVTHSRACHDWFMHVPYDSGARTETANPCRRLCIHVPWLIHVCAMTHSRVCHDWWWWLL